MTTTRPKASTARRNTATSGGNRKLAPQRVPKATASPACADDDRVVTALNLPQAELTPEVAAYFDKCSEKLGFIPNVLKAYAFDMAKLGGMKDLVPAADIISTRFKIVPTKL